MHNFINGAFLNVYFYDLCFLSFTQLFVSLIPMNTQSSNTFIFLQLYSVPVQKMPHFIYTFSY